jgi:hypothetical protein
VTDENQQDGRSFRSSIEVIEDFYGDGFSAALLALMRHTPIEQLIELADRLVRHNRAIERALDSRVYQAAIGKSYSRYVSAPLVAHEVAYIQGGETSQIVETPQLKHLLLLSEHVLLPDPIIDWAEETLFLEQAGQSWSEHETGYSLYSAAKQVLDIVPWVRVGAVALIASRNNLGLGYVGGEEYGVGRYPLKFQGTLDLGGSDIFWRDPYLAWCIVHKLNVIEPWRFDSWGLNTQFEFQEAASYILGEMEYDKSIVSKLNSLVAHAHGPGVTIADVEIACQLNMMHADAGVTPVTSTLVAAKHLARSAMAVMDGLAAPNVALLVPI